MNFPPSTSVVERGGHVALRNALDEHFKMKGSVARMSIFAKDDLETVYLEFNKIEPSAENMNAKQELVTAGEFAVQRFVLRPQLILA